MDGTDELTLVPGVTEDSMTPAKARGIIKSFLMGHPNVVFDHNALPDLVPGLKPRQFNNLMTKIKASYGFAGGYRKVVYIGSAPPSLRTAPTLTEVYMRTDGGATLSELRQEYGNAIDSHLYNLRQKGAIKSNGRGKPEAVPVDQIPLMVKNRAARGAVTSAIRAYAAEHHYQWVSKSDFLDAMVEKGLRRKTIQVILPRLIKAGDLTLEETGEQYRFGVAGEDGIRAELKPEMPLQYKEPDAPSIDWRDSLREAQNAEGVAIRYMENALEGLRGEDRKFVSCYLSQILCNPNTYDSGGKTYRPGNADFRKAAVVSDAVKRFRKDGSVPDEIYAAMQVLSPVDNRTTYIWGESLRDKGLELLRDVGMQKDPESACRVARGRYKIFLGYDA